MNSKRHTIIQTIILAALLILINVIVQRWYFYIDLTEDKRFTIENSTKQLIEDVDDRIMIEVLLEGDLSSSFVRLQNRTLEILRQFNSLNANIEFSFTDPSSGTVDDINMRRQNLSQDGIYPSTLFIVEDDQRVQKLIYPYAIVNFGDRRVPINLLESMGVGENEEEAVNRSAVLLEYKLTSAIAKLMKREAPIVMFTEGNNELEDSQTAMLETILGKTMVTGRINLDSIYKISEEVDLLIVAGPETELGLKKQFILDQYIMNGGKVIWLMNQFFVNLDSINHNKGFLPKPVEHGLDQMFFKYGVRINKNVILDLENSQIPQVFGVQGDRVQQQLFPWVFHPLLQANPENPIVRNIDRVMSTFPSTIDILETPLNTESTVLLTSSQYSRYQVYPSINISFEILKLEQRPEAYNKSHLPVAVIVEGEFESFFKNRVSEEMLSGLSQINSEFKEKSAATSQLFVADADIIKNLYNEATNQISPIGHNKWESYTYEGNEDFIINCIDYMLDDYGLVEARSKNLKLRLLDQVEIQNNRLKWQIINLLIPSLLLILGGFLFNYFRKKKFAA